MEYAALLIALLGLVTGIMFRLRVLLTLVAVLLVTTILVSIKSGFGFPGTALAIMVAQTILQGSYFLGLVLAAIASAAGREHRRRSDYSTLRARSATGRRRPFHGF
jgi:hypothetical protein